MALLLGCWWLGQARGLADTEFFGQVINSSQLPVDWNCASICQHKLLLWLLADQSSLEFDNFLVDVDNGLGAEALYLQDGRIGIVLDQADNFVLVELRSLREGKDLQIESLVDLELSFSWLDDERRLIGGATLISWQSRLEDERGLKIVLSIVCDLEEGAIDLLYFVFFALLRVLANKQWAEVEDVLTDDESLREVTLRLCCRSGLLLVQVEVPWVLTDSGEVT